VARILGRPAGTIAERLMPYDIDHPGSGARLRWHRHEVAAAVIWAALGNTTAHRAVAYAMGNRYRTHPPPAMAMVWPDGWVELETVKAIPRHLGRTTPPAVTLVHLGHLLAPLRRDPPP
jgi:hypothetical protein